MLHRPGSVKDRLSNTLEDETGIASGLMDEDFRKYRTVVKGTSMMDVHWRAQHDGDVIQLVAFGR